MFIETEVPESEIIISRTDLKGIITYVNDTFAEISGYSADELIGRPHNILRHPDMPKSAFADMWETIKRGETWEGYVKNMRKDRGYYWVYAVISGVYRDGELVEYKSLRSPVAKEKRIEMQKEYDRLREEEDGIVRVLSYMDSSTLSRLKKRADEAQMSPERYLDTLL
jgi:aerotaxis receptor